MATRPKSPPPLVNGSSKPSEEDSVARTKVLLTGLRRSGKTSIYEHIFNGMPKSETFYLETTMRVQKHSYDTVIPLEIWDCPPNTMPDSIGAPLSEFSAMIYVIDIQLDNYQPPIQRLLDFVVTASAENPEMSIDVFVHKAETQAEDYRIENFRHIQQRVFDELDDLSVEYQQMSLNFYLTSVYDHTIHDALSRVLHRLIGSLPFIEELLNVFSGNSQASKSFLYDITSRLYVATDASPVDEHTHNLCCDFINMLNKFGSLYKSVSACPTRNRPSPSPSTALSSPHSPRTPSPPSAASPQSLLPQSPVRPPPPSASRSHDASKLKLKSTQSTPTLFYPSASSSLSASTTLTYHVVTPRLALVAVLPTTVWEMRRGLVEYNIVFFRQGAQDISDLEWAARGASGREAPKGDEAET